MSKRREQQRGCVVENNCVKTLQDGEKKVTAQQRQESDWRERVPAKGSKILANKRQNARRLRKENKSNDCEGKFARVVNVKNASNDNENSARDRVETVKSNKNGTHKLA
jgi:hypothetical protein